MPQYIKDIIRNRYYKADAENSNFDKFIALWISFSAFYSNYSQKYIEELELKKVSEDFQTSFDVWSREESIGEFYEYIKNRKVFGFSNVKKGLLNLYCYKKNDIKIGGSSTEDELIQSNEFEISDQYNGIRVRNMTGPKNMLIRYYDDRTDLRAFIFVLYQIRCNLFHGGKDTSEVTDQEVMEKAVPALKIFLEKLYTQEDILNLND